MSRRARPTFWIVVAATLLAAFSRWWGLSTLPPQAWVDEIWFALRARDLLQTGEVLLFYPTFWGGVHPMFVWLTALAQLAGLRDVIVAARAVSSVAGLLSVPLAYVCFGELWRGWLPASRRRLAAALTAVILANLFFTITAARLGTEPAVSVAAALFCVWQIRRAQRLGRWPGWIAAGLALGLAQYVSPHARFIIPLIALMALHDLATRAAPERRRVFLGYAAAAAISLGAAAPLIAFFAREPQWFWGRARAVTVEAAQGGPAFYLDNLRLIALSFSFIGDPSLRENLPGRPLLDPIQSIGLVIGLGGAIAALRRSRPARELPAWLAIMIVPSLITDEAPGFGRMIGAAPPVAALVALGWLAIGRWLGRLRPGWAARSVAGLAAVSLGLNAYDYFGRYAAHPELPAEYTVAPVRLARDLIARSADERVFVERWPDRADVFAFDFLMPGTRVERLDFLQCLPRAYARATRTTYLILGGPERDQAVELLRDYPEARPTVITPEVSSLMPVSTLIEVPPGALAPAPQYTAQARFEPGLRLLGYAASSLSARAGQTVFLTFYWLSEGDLDRDYTRFVHVGTGLAASPLAGQADGWPCQNFYPTSRWRAGDVIPDGFAVTLAPDAAPGDYSLIAGWYDPAGPVRLPLTEAQARLPDDRAIVGTVVVLAP